VSRVNVGDRAIAISPAADRAATSPAWIRVPTIVARWIASGIGAGLALLTLASAAPAALPQRAPDQILAGHLTGADSMSNRDQPFTLPESTARLVVSLSHDGDPKASLIQLGVDDPQGFRGTGAPKTDFTIAAYDATPGFFPGRLVPGRWDLRFFVGQLPQDRAINWTAKLWFMKTGERLPVDVPGRGPGWYRGDLHMHSGHSDGTCANASGKSVPCPLYLTIASAAARKLDFAVLTEHNTVSSLQVIRELQPYFDRLLLIPGQEVTTHFGHIGVWGVEEPIDYRVEPGVRSFNTLADEVHRLGGLVSINHPAAPTGAMCLGCGWSMPDVDYAKVDAVEAINGGIIAIAGGRDPEGPLTNIPFWLKHLAAGDRLVAVGGSDSHDGTNAADHPPAVGNPTTVVYARDLTQGAILEGIRSGRVFIDLAMDPTDLLDLSVSDDRQEAAMGGRMQSKAPVTAKIVVRAQRGERLELLDGSTLLSSRPIAEPAGEAAPPLSFPLALSPGNHAIRAQVRGKDGKLLLLSNPVLVTIG